MKGNKVPPAKKAAPKSLADLLDSKKEDTPEGPPVDQENISPEVETPASEVVDSEEPVDEQAAANPDGVSFSGNQNVINKTPADLSSETPEESRLRFGIPNEVPDDVHNDPNVTANRDMGFVQIPSGTHLHPDIARDNYNRGVGGQAENSQVTRTVTEHVYATPALQDDKGRNEHFSNTEDDGNPQYADVSENDDKRKYAEEM